jgi:FixJ family two-component response regulator
MMNSVERQAIEGNPRLVVAVDDEPEILTSLKMVLALKGYQAVCFSSAEALLAAGVPQGAACLLLDINMPRGMDGLALLELLRRDGSSLPTIMVSGTGDIRSAVRALKAGASDFIEKPYSQDALLAAVTGCVVKASGKPHGTEAVERFARLSIRERQVLDFVLEGLSSKQIAAQLDISPRTVDIHRGNIMAKTGARNVPDLIRLAVSSGAVRPGFFTTHERQGLSQDTSGE